MTDGNLVWSSREWREVAGMEWKGNGFSLTYHWPWASDSISLHGGFLLCEGEHPSFYLMCCCQDPVSFVNHACFAYNCQLMLFWSWWPCLLPDMPTNFLLAPWVLKHSLALALWLHAPLYQGGGCGRWPMSPRLPGLLHSCQCYNERSRGVETLFRFLCCRSYVTKDSVSNIQTSSCFHNGIFVFVFSF